MKRIISILLSLVLIAALAACSPPDTGDSSGTKGDNGNPTEQPPYDDAEKTEVANTNFATTAGTVLYHDGYTYFISGSTAYLSDGYGNDFYEGSYELLRISDDKSASAEVLHTFEMVEPRYMFYANGRIWFVETTIDAVKGDTTISMASILPNGSDYQNISSDNLTASARMVIGEHDGKLYFVERTAEDGVNYCYFDANNSRWDTLNTSDILDISEDVELGLYILTIDDGYMYYCKGMQAGGGEQMGLWRAKLYGEKAELITRLTVEETEDWEPYAFLVTEDYLYLESKDCIKAISIETGDVLTVIEDIVSNGILTCNATEDGLYYINENGLFLYKPREGKSQLLQNNTSVDRFMYLAVCGEWFVYTDYGTTNEFYRVKNTATQLPEAYFYKEKW